MRRLNVREAQINECIQNSMFASSIFPRKPELQQGELLLLQLVKHDAKRLNKLDERISFALVFERIEQDIDGSISRLHWPSENRVWPWIIYCSATLTMIPFSLEDLPLSVNNSYQGQDNPRYINMHDQELIKPLILWNAPKNHENHSEINDKIQLFSKFEKPKLFSIIANHDRITLSKPSSKKEVVIERFTRNQWLAESLKAYYQYCCQICGKNFFTEYGVNYIETHHIHYISQNGSDTSTNMIVLCPNHHRIIHATNAYFDRATLSYHYPNGLKETLLLNEHLY